MYLACISLSPQLGHIANVNDFTPISFNPGATKVGTVVEQHAIKLANG